MLKKLLITSVLLTHGYSAAPAQSSETIAGGGALSATLVDPVTEPSSVQSETQAKVYPNLPADGYGDIFKAAEAGDLNAVQEFIRNGADPKAVNLFRTTVLHEAASSGNLTLVEYLVGLGADPRALDVGRRTILHWAASSGNLTLVQYLVGLGADPRAVASNGTTVLHEAASSGNLALVQYLVGLGADPRAVNRYGHTILNNAAESGNLDLVKYLVGFCPDLKAVDISQLTVLHRAVHSENLVLVEYLVGLCPDLRNDRYRGDALHRAVINCYFHILAYFADLGLEIPGKYYPQVNVIRERARQALEGRQLRGPIDRAPIVDKDGNPKPSTITLWRRIGGYRDLVGVSKDDINNGRYISPVEVDLWNNFSDERRSSILERVKSVQSEQYLFYVLEKIRLKELEGLRDESLLLAELRSVGTGLFDDEAVDGNEE